MARKVRKRLDQDAVLHAAVDILNTEGLQALTLKHLAEKLGIQTPSLYNHVDGLPGLQRELAILNGRLLTDRLSEAALGKSGTALFMDVAEAYRGHIKGYPGLYMSTLRASGTQTEQDPRLQQQEERALKVGLAIMNSLGLQDADAIHGLRAFRSLVHGFATLEIAGGFGLPEDCDESFRRLVIVFMAGLQTRGAE